MDKFKYINYEEIILPSESNQDRGFRISFNNIEIRCVLDGHGCNFRKKPNIFYNQI